LKRLLMVAFHFPPLAGGSGIQRTLRLVQQLPALGWQPLVLSANARAYPETGTDLLAEVPPGTVVQRAWALDAARHLAIRGRYPGWLARPDRWVSWQWAGVRDGLRLIQTYQPQVIWSTYPLATAHLIGARLQQLSGLPWVADFRDPMAQDGYPADPRLWRSFKRIEMRAMQQAACCVFTTPGAAQTYRQRYPAAASSIRVVENGFDEASFAGLDAAAGALNPGRLTLLHSGLVYPSERDPSQLFAALARVFQAGLLARDAVRLRFRAAQHEALLDHLATQHGVRDVIELCPPLPYRQALHEMLRADALLVMQAANCNAQIPAKLYEYLRAGRPILALTDPAGDTAATLRAAGIHALAALDNTADMARVLPQFFADLALGRAGLPDPLAVVAASRQSRAQQMALLLDEVLAEFVGVAPSRRMSS